MYVAGKIIVLIIKEEYRCVFTATIKTWFLLEISMENKMELE